LQIAMGAALVYCLCMEVLFLTGGRMIGTAFIHDPGIAAQVASILRPMAVFYLLTGPVLVLALYFQAIGQPERAGLLTLSKPFVLLPASIATFAAVKGAGAVWFAFPLADGIMALLVLAIFVPMLRRRGESGQPDLVEH
jgi:Na+-driven multidrug efflux pump